MTVSSSNDPREDSPQGNCAEGRLPRIAYIMSRFPHLPETFIVREMNELTRQGWDVSLYPLILQDSAIIHPSAEKWLPLSRKLPYLSPGVFFANMGWFCRRPVRYLSTLLRAVLENFTSPNYLIRMLALFPKSVYAATLMQADGIQHVHAHYASHPALAAWIIHRLTGVSYSITAHAHDIYVRQNMLTTKLRDAAFVAAISEYNREFLAGHCGQDLRGKIHVIHCGVSLDRFARRHHIGPHTPLRVLCVGSLQPYKGQSFLVEALALLRDRGVPASCTIIGHGNMADSLQAQIREHGLDGVVQLVGKKTEDEVAAHLLEADCYVQPSVVTPTGKMEGIPVAIMEAMASGVPVVATAISGVTELVRSGETGRTVPPEDAPALADAITDVCHDSDASARMSEAAHNLVLDEFEITGTVRSLSETFKKSIEPRAELPVAAHCAASSMDRLGRHLGGLPNWVWAAVSAVAGVLATLVALRFSNPLLPLAGVAALGFAVAMLVRPELGAPVMAGAVYTRLFDVLRKEHGLPSLLPLFMLVLIAGIVLKSWRKQSVPEGWQRVLLWAALFMACCLPSLVAAADLEVAATAWRLHARGIVAAVLITVVMQGWKWFVLTIRVWVAAVACLAAVGVYQHVTQSFDQSFWGFGTASVKHIVDNVSGYRISGPMSDPNFFAQLLVAVVPCAYERVCSEKHRWMRLLFAAALLLCVIAIVFTFSRGALVALTVVGVLVLWRRPPPRWAWGWLVIAFLLVSLLVPSDYVLRVKSAVASLPGAGDRQLSESSLRGRASEMIVGWQMFVDHPFTGVGMDNYPLLYQDYARRLGLDKRIEDRSPHSLYVESLAETGLPGFVAFIVLLGAALHGLHKTATRFGRARQPDRANTCIAFQASLIGYLVAGFFLHNAYPMPFWVLIGLAFSVSQLACAEYCMDTPEAALREPVGEDVLQPA